MEEKREPEDTKELEAEIKTYSEEYKEAVRNFFSEIGLESEAVDNLPENFWVAMAKDNKVVGTVGISDCENRIAQLKRMYVEEELRGKGLGKRLMSAVIDFAKQNGYEKMFLITSPENIKAQEFYTKNGWEKVDAPPDTQATYPDGRAYFEIDLKREK